MYDCFIQIDEIPGESTDEKHATWIEPMSFSFGASQTIAQAVSAGSRAAGRVDLQDFSFMKALDSASTKLFSACCKGTPIKKVTMEVCRADGAKQVFMKVEMSNLYITSYQPSGQAGGQLPTESVTMNFGQIVATYLPSDHNTMEAKGNIPGGWDQELNKEITALS